MSISASEARRRLFPLLEQVNTDHEPVRITSKAGDAVLMSADDYDSWQETVYLLRSPENARHSWRPSPETRPTAPHRGSTRSRSTNSRRWPAAKVRSISFDPDAWEDFQFWLASDRKTARRITRLIGEIQRDPFTGIGKPEPLKAELSGYWSADRRRTSARIPRRRSRSQDPQSPIPLLTGVKRSPPGCPRFQEKNADPTHSPGARCAAHAVKIDKLWRHAEVLSK